MIAMPQPGGDLSVNLTHGKVVPEIHIIEADLHPELGAGEARQMRVEKDSGKGGWNRGTCRTVTDGPHDIPSGLVGLIHCRILRWMWRTVSNTCESGTSLETTPYFASNLDRGAEYPSACSARRASAPCGTSTCGIIRNNRRADDWSHST